MRKSFFMRIAAACMIFFVGIPFTAVSVGSIAAGNGMSWVGKGSDTAGMSGFDSSSKKAKERKTSNNETSTVEAPSKIKVWKEDENKTISIDFEEYVSNVVASEMPSSFELEALKAQSVAARTFAMAKIEKYDVKKPTSHPDAPVCSSTHCQVYKTEDELIACHADGWEKSEDGFAKIKKACKATEGQFLYYDGQLVMQPLFFSSSGGQTENSEDVFVSALPYLVSVSSPYEDEATHSNEKKSFTIDTFVKTVKEAFPEKDFGRVERDNIRVLSRTAGGRVDRMQIGDATIKGTEVRTALGLSSSLFSVDFENDEDDEGLQNNNTKIVFTSNGSGHGVGMSQYGANGMAKNGYKYRDILKHYYSGTEVL